MAADLNGQSLAIWNNLKPMIDEEIKSQTKGMVQRRKAKVTTAPSLSTGTIGVTEPFGTEYFIPFNTNLTTASVGDFVWVEFMYGATNAFASMYASADTKDYTVGGNLTVIGDEEVNGNTTINGVLDVPPRRCFSSLSMTGWYRVMTFATSSAADINGANGLQIDLVINRSFSSTNNETHRVSLEMTYNNIAFTNESSLSNYQAITKIRYNTNTSGSTKYGYVDIYYSSNDANFVYVDFIVRQAYKPNQAAIKANEPFLIGDSPANETRLAEYGFIGTSGQRNTFTPAYGTAAFGGCWYARNGEYVTVHVGLAGLTANTAYTIGTLPVGYRPIAPCCSSGSSQTFDKEAHLYVRDSGNIDVWSPNAMASLDATFMWR